MSAISAGQSTGLRVSAAGTRTRQTESVNFGTLLKNKAQAKKGLNPKQMAAYDKQMLTAVQDTKPLLQADADRLMVAAVVPGSLGVLQPSGADLAKVALASQDVQLANVDMQNMLQKQQQTMQMMSNISKSFHDTAKAIISNIRA